MPENKLTVSARMYRLGELGDCFLLRFKEGTKFSNVLLDCGSFRNKKTSSDRMRAILKNIKTTLKTQPLHVVVGTHQHNDHVSGFVHGKDLLPDLSIGEAWLSWLDDPRDRKAKALKNEQEKTMQTIAKLGRHLENLPFKNHKAVHRLHEIMEFSTNFSDAPEIPAAGIQILKTVGKNKPKYLDPGSVVSLPGMEGLIEVFVLGPPVNREQLLDITANSSESYDHGLTNVRVTAEKMISALANYNDKIDGWEENHFPFTNHYNITKDEFNQQAKTNEKYRRVWEAYEAEEWRNIDDEWLEEAGNLALYMDKYTNNTSLALAFHIKKTGKYLLFVGDAQTGNWTSWKSLKWKNVDDHFSLHNLLANTILYKVGHHCSHNATLVEGLEAMTDPDLVAMIPVDENDPNITKANGWKMPAKNLYRKLKEKTNYRVLRMDTGFADECGPDNTQKNKWKSLSYDDDIKVTDLYVEHKMNF